MTFFMVDFLPCFTVTICFFPLEFVSEISYDVVFLATLFHVTVIFLLPFLTLFSVTLAGFSGVVFAPT